MKKLYYCLLLTLICCFYFTNAFANGSNGREFFIDAPLVAGNTSLCAPGSTALTATSTAGSVFEWYTAATGGTPIHTGAVYSNTYSVTTTVYVSVRNGTETSPRTAVIVNVHTPPTSAFTAPTTVNCATQALSFTNNSTGSNLEYVWDFGNTASGSSNTSTVANPNHTFVATPGNEEQTFTVRLTVTNSSTNCTDTTTRTVRVKQLPDASLLGSNSSLYNGFTTFKVCQNSVSSFNFGNGSSTQSTNTNYTIDWGDNSADFNSTTFNSAVSHTYQVGLWTLTYTIEGQNGCSITKVYKVFVGSNPAVAFGNPGNTDLCITGNVQDARLVFPITGTANNAPGTTYTVTFSDDPNNPEIYNHPPPAEVPHIYTRTSCGSTATSFQNSFSVTIVARNPCSQSLVSVIPIYISTKPDGDFTMPNTSACVNTTTCFTNATVNSNSIDASDGACISGAPILWSITPNTGYTLISGSMGFALDPNDATSWATGSNQICPRFTQPGTYSIKMRVGNRCGVDDDIIKTICIESPITSAAFTLNNTTGCGSVTAQATNTTVTTNTCNVTYNWAVAYSATNCGTQPGSTHSYFINGTTATSVNPSFNFPNPGTYTVTLTASNSCSPPRTASQTVVVKAPPTAVITTISSICGGTSATITPRATVTNCGDPAGTPTYLWSFPGGTPSTSNLAIPPAVSYNTAGSYTVTLAVTNECGTANDTKTFTVTQGVTANAGSDITSCAVSGSTPLNGIGGGGSGGTYTYRWLPVTGLSNPNIANPVASPTVTTTYTLTVSQGQCSGTDDVTVFVNALTAGTTSGNQTICYNTNPSAFTVLTAATGAGTLTYQWQSSLNNSSFADIAGATTETFAPPVLSQTTYYRRIVTGTLNGLACQATGNVITVIVNNIYEGVVAGDQTICSGGDPVAFTASTIATGSGLLSYQWQSSPDNVTFAAIASATSETYNPSVLTQATYYRRIATSTLGGVACSAISNVITITLTTAPDVTTTAFPAQNLCQGATAQPLTVAVTGATGTYSYQWYSNPAPNTTTGTLISGATTNTLLPPTTTTGIRYYYVIVSGTGPGCSDTSPIAEVNVIAAPAITSQPAPQTLCVGQAPTVLSVSYVNGTGTPTFQWYSNTTNSVTGSTAISSATTAAYQPPSTVGTVYYYAVITFPTGGCSTITSNIIAVIINVLPSVNTTQAQTICSGTAFTVTPADGGGNTLPVGTQYIWATPTGTGFTGSSVQTAPVATISQTLTNTTNAPVTAIYQVTPVANGCSGTDFSVTITVNPKPAIPNQIQTVCSGDAFTVSPVNAGVTIVPAGTTYSWTAPTVSGGLTGGMASSANATSITGALTNPTNADQTAIYTVIPTWTSGSQTCTGDTFTVTVTIKPKPVITNMAQTACSSVAFSVIPTNGTDGIVPEGTTYSWAAPAAVAGISGLAPGTNQLTVSGTLINTTTAPVIIEYIVTPISGNCTGTPFTVNITVNPMPTVAAVSNQTVCNGSLTTAITFSGTLPGTIFNWVNRNPTVGIPASGLGDIAAFTALNTGTGPVTATITVTPQLNGCDGTPQIFIISVNPAPTVTFSIADQTICSSTASTAVNLTSSTTGTTISWTVSAPAGISGAATGTTSTTIPAQTLINSTSAPLTVTYTATAITADASACPGAPVVYSITVTPVPFVNTLQQTTICSGTTLNYIPNNTGGNNMPAGATFTWTAPNGTGFTGGSAQSTPQNSLNPTLVNTTNVPVTATYTVTPHYNGCHGVPFTVEVTVNPTASIPNTTLTICSSSAFSFDPATVATILPAGTAYSWAAPTGNITGGASGSAQTLITGTLTNTSSAAETAIYTITPLSPLGNCAGNPFTLTVTVNPVFAVTSTVSNYNGFQISTAGASDGSISLFPTGGSGTYTYAWTGPNGFTSSAQNIANLGPGIYSVTITDGLCTGITLPFTITEPLPLVITEVLASHINVNCFGQSTGVIEVEITQVSIAPFDYALLLADGTVVEEVLNLTAENYVFDNLPAGTYNVKVTDANGTVKFINGIVITQPASGVAVTAAVPSDFNGFSISCNGANNGSIDLTVSGGYPGYTYAWTGPNGFTAATEDISGLSPGVYSVIINDTTNACPITQNYTVTEPQVVAFTGTVPTFNGYEISCFGGSNGSITIAPTGGTSVYSYSWTGPNGFTASTQNLTGLAVGTYQLNITDSNGCSTPSQSFTLTQPAAISVTESHINVLCYGYATGAIDVTVAGGVSTSGTYTYAWTGPNGYTSVSEDLVSIVAGTYTLVATDNNGCTIPLSVTITQQPEIIITPTTTPITCYGANNASISLAITGGAPPYITTWSNLATGIYQDNLAAGDYIITVTDASNCVKVITVPIPEAPVFMVTPVYNNISCHGAHDGNIDLNLVGGIAPITLVWSDGSTQGTRRNNLPAGTYTATISDSSPYHCQIIRTFTIVEPAALAVSANITHALDCDDTMSGAINLLVAGGTPPFTFNWSNGSTNEDLTAITSGTYNVNITDFRGCTASGTYTITRPAPVTLRITEDIDFNCQTQYVQQVNTAQAAGGVPPFTYTWSGGTVSGNNGQYMTTNQNGTVIVTATDSKGCIATQAFEVATQQLGEASFTADSYGFTTYRVYSVFDEVQFANISTGDFIEASWDFGDGSVSVSESAAHTYVREGTYTVTLTLKYPYGCVSTFRQTLEVTKGYDVMVPNAFTPNGDGTNDTFSPVYKGLKLLELNVYDTWGALIYYEKGEVIKGWDGNLKKITSENGNFYYRISVETFYGQIVNFEGPFVLLK